MSTFTALRGLDERIAFAQAKIDALFNKMVGIDVEPDVGDVCNAADVQGYYDYMDGIHVAPILYRDEPMLVSSWNSGQAFAVVVGEICCCSSCQNPDIDICSIHG